MTTLKDYLNDMLIEYDEKSKEIKTQSLADAIKDLEELRDELSVGVIEKMVKFLG